MCQQIEVVWEISQVLVKHSYMGLCENRARKYPGGIIFQIELPLGSTARFQTHLNFQFASEVHMGARTLHPASVAWQSWSLPDNSRVLRLCPDLSGRV